MAAWQGLAAWQVFSSGFGSFVFVPWGLDCVGYMHGLDRDEGRIEGMHDGVCEELILR